MYLVLFSTLQSDQRPDGGDVWKVGDKDAVMTNHPKGVAIPCLAQKVQCTLDLGAINVPEHQN